MPTTLQCTNFELSADEVAKLWQQVLTTTGHHDDLVAVRCVGEEEMQELNGAHRGKKAATNILTFTYKAAPPLSVEGGAGEHDIVLCQPVATREAKVRHVSHRDYLALLLVHAFLHAAGLDHEESPELSQRTAKYEREILQQCGFQPNVL